MNQTERKNAIRKFALIYGLSLVVVVIAAWLLFHTPVWVYKSAIRGFANAQDEQSQLQKKVESITTNLQKISQADQAYLSSTNDIEKGGLQANVQEYQKNISDALVSVKNDSASFNSQIAKKSSFSYIVAYNSILAYRNTLASLQKSLAEKGGDAAELLKVQGQLQNANAQLEICKISLAARPQAAAPPSSGGSGGGGGNKANEEKLQKQLDEAQANLAACIRTKGATVAPPPNTNLSETAKATLLYDSGEDLMNTAAKTKNLLERRGILSAARQILQKSQGAYPDPDKVKKAIQQIDSDLKRLSNMG